MGINTNVNKFNEIPDTKVDQESRAGVYYFMYMFPLSVGNKILSTKSVPMLTTVYHAFD